MSNNEKSLVQVEPQAVTKHVPALTVEIVRKFFCANATPIEAALFVEVCKSQGLNPFIGDAYLIKYRDTDPAKTVVGKYTFVKRAEDHPQFDGMEAGIIVQNKTKVEHRAGSFLTKDDELIGGWARVHRKDHKYPFYNEVGMDEYLQKTKDGKPFRSWARMPATMIRKVALLQSLREAFPNLLGGLYGAEEMPVETADAEVLPITGKEKPTKSEEVEPAELISENERADMFAMLKDAKISTVHLQNHYKKEYGSSVLSKITKTQLPDILDWIKENAKD